MYWNFISKNDWVSWWIFISTFPTKYSDSMSLCGGKFQDMDRTVNANLSTVGVGFRDCFWQNISVRKRVNTQKTQYLCGSANNAYIHREKRFSLDSWGKIHNNGLVSHYKMIIPRPEPPFFSSSSLSFFFFLSAVCPPYFSFLFFLLFYFFFLHGPKWAYSHRSEWAYGYNGPASIFFPLQ